jgi:hypothetical protein
MIGIFYNVTDIKPFSYGTNEYFQASYKLYWLYATFGSGKDRVANQPLSTTLAAGRPTDMNSGVLAGENESAISAAGKISYGGYTNL